MYITQDCVNFGGFWIKGLEDYKSQRSEVRGPESGVRDQRSEEVWIIGLEMADGKAREYGSGLACLVLASVFMPGHDFHCEMGSP